MASFRKPWLRNLELPSFYSLDGRPLWSSLRRVSACARRAWPPGCGFGNLPPSNARPGGSFSPAQPKWRTGRFVCGAFELVDRFDTAMRANEVRSRPLARCSRSEAPASPLSCGRTRSAFMPNRRTEVQAKHQRWAVTEREAVASYDSQTRAWPGRYRPLSLGFGRLPVEATSPGDPATLRGKVLTAIYRPGRPRVRRTSRSEIFRRRRCAAVWPRRSMSRAPPCPSS